MVFYRDAFDELNTDRVGFGLGLGPIPWTAIRKYAEVYEMSLREFEHFLIVIRLVDDAFRAHMKKKTPEPGGNKRGGQPQPPRRRK